MGECQTSIEGIDIHTSRISSIYYSLFWPMLNTPKSQSVTTSSPKKKTVICCHGFSQETIMSTLEVCHPPWFLACLCLSAYGRTAHKHYLSLQEDGIPNRERHQTGHQSQKRTHNYRIVQSDIRPSPSLGDSPSTVWKHRRCIMPEPVQIFDWRRWGEEEEATSDRVTFMVKCLHILI